LEDKVAFNKLCSSLDVLGDVELAFDTYLSSDEHAAGGEKYLYVYGVLQALFIEQDAVRHLHEALGFAYEVDPQTKNP